MKMLIVSRTRVLNVRVLDADVTAEALYYWPLALLWPIKCP